MASYMNQSLDGSFFQTLDTLFGEWIPKHNGVYIFGRGKYGVGFAHYLKNCGIEIAGHVVSAPAASCEPDDVSVISTDEFRMIYETAEEKPGLILGIGFGHYREVLPTVVFAWDDLFMLNESMKWLAAKHYSITEKMNFTFDFAHHCNLNCHGCSVGSSISGEAFCNPDVATKDLEKIKSLLGNVKQVNLSGGESLLHPNFIELVKIVRKIYPKSLISIATNGILLSDKDESFWKVLGDIEVELHWTYYPIGYDNSNETCKKAAKAGVPILMVGDTADSPKTTWQLPFNANGGEKIYDYLMCGFYKDHGDHFVLRDSRIIICNAATRAGICNEAFGTNLPVSEGYGFRYLSKIETTDELMRFVNSRPGLCEYCAVRKRHSKGKWLRSEKKYEEWFI